MATRVYYAQKSRGVWALAMAAMGKITNEMEKIKLGDGEKIVSKRGNTP